MSNESGLEVEVVRANTAQETALAALRAGSSFATAAREAGVNRATVYRWVQRDPGFRAAYNAWRGELAESANARLLKMTERAVELIGEALEKGDRQIAFKMLRQMGMLRPRRRGTTDEQVLTLQMDLKQRRELQRAEGNMFDYLLEKMGVPPRERKRVVSGRAAPELIQRLRAAVGRSASAGGTESLDATFDPPPRESSQEMPGESAGSTEHKLKPEQCIAQPSGAGEQGPGDATIRATNQGASQERVA